MESTKIWLRFLIATIMIITFYGQSAMGQTILLQGIVEGQVYGAPLSGVRVTVRTAGKLPIEDETDGQGGYYIELDASYLNQDVLIEFQKEEYNKTTITRRISAVMPPVVTIMGYDEIQIPNGKIAICGYLIRKRQGVNGLKIFEEKTRKNDTSHDKDSTEGFFQINVDPELIGSPMINLLLEGKEYKAQNWTPILIQPGKRLYLENYQVRKRIQPSTWLIIGGVASMLASGVSHVMYTNNYSDYDDRLNDRMKSQADAAYDQAATWLTIRNTTFYLGLSLGIGGGGLKFLQSQK